jgi:hypothetical protein
MIIYSNTDSTNNAAIGKLETPIKMIIEHESDIICSKGGIRDLLFNVEKSNRFGETIIGGNEFEVFKATVEGDVAESDNIRELYSKFIEHVQFMKEFSISATMMEDAVNGIAADTKRRAENFVRAYYKTMNKLCEYALINGENETLSYAGATIDLTSPDGYSLFHGDHSWGNPDDTYGAQCNLFYGNIFSDNAEEKTYSTEVLDEALSALSVKMRNMLDENGEPLGYTADTIIIPGNKPKLEKLIRTVCGSQFVTGSANNDVNLNYGCWNVIVLPHWQPTDDRMMIMSSEANRNLCGNMFFNRVPLTITNWVDNHSGNYVWNGRCRFGVGFGSYKHIMLAVDSSDYENGYNLYD